MKKRASVTQKQIAERAGVSQTVVSLALNNSYDISLSEETRQRVIDVAAELGYVPQAAAKALVHGRSSNIGLVLIQPHYQVFRDPYIPNIITGVTGAVRRHGFRLLVEHIDDLEHLDTISDLLRSGEVAGLILSNHSLAGDTVRRLVEDGYPITVIDRSSFAPHFVMIDHESGVRSVASHLAQLGHRRIACITYSPLSAHLSRRYNAFVNQLEENGVVFDEAYLRLGYYDPDSGYAAMQSILEMHPRPTAVFGMNDFMALGAMRAVQDAGLRVPDDIAVVGYDDMRFSPFTYPPLTTVRAPEVEQGQAAGEMLMGQVLGYPVSERQIVLTPEFIIRDSCGGR